MNTPARLSVNVNKIALIRNSRGADFPNLLSMCLDIEAYGADGITVHPRPDQRHIKYEDIGILKAHLRKELNIEGYPTPAFTDLVLAHHPAQVTLVPDPPGALTSDQGWDIPVHGEKLVPLIRRFKDAGIRVSLFIDADPVQVASAASVGADRIELYTGPYAHAGKPERAEAIVSHMASADKAMELNLGINAGHDLNLHNLAYYAYKMPALNEVSIGHALIVDAMYFGYSNVVAMYKDRLLNPIHYL